MEARSPWRPWRSRRGRQRLVVGPLQLAWPKRLSYVKMMFCFYHNHIIISTYVPKNMWKLLPARRPPLRAQISWFIRSQFCRNCVLLVDGFWLDCFCNCNYKCILYKVRWWPTIKPIINSRNPFLGVQSSQMLHIELPEDSPHLILVSPHHLRFPFSDFSDFTDFSLTIWGFHSPW